MASIRIARGSFQGVARHGLDCPWCCKPTDLSQSGLWRCPHCAAHIRIADGSAKRSDGTSLAVRAMVLFLFVLFGLPLIIWALGLR